MAQHTRRLQARQNDNKVGWGNNLQINQYHKNEGTKLFELPTLSPKLFTAKFGWDKSQPSPYVPPGLGATEGNGARQRRH